MWQARRNGGFIMNTEPRIEQRPAQPYAGIRRRVTMDSLGGAVDEAFPELFGWLAARDVPPSGPPFIRYLVIDMARELDIELGVPAEMSFGDDGPVRAGVLPAGRYVVLRHTGPYDGLIASNAALLHWADEQGIALDSWDTADGTAWRGRAEHYLTNPAEEPDPAKWEVDVAFLTATP
jgi:effector-binding domain-containing protein